MRKFKGGATRGNADGKINYAHSSALAERVWCEYMHQHRIQEDGKLREPDNYKKGMDVESYRTGLAGHNKDIELLLEGHKVFEKGKEVTPFDAIMASKFNLQGLIIELMRGYPIPREYTEGRLKAEFNKRFYKWLEK